MNLLSRWLSSKTDTPAKKHLKIQIVYGGGRHPDARIDITHQVDKNHLREKQKKYLKNKYSVMEEVFLDKNMVLVGLTKYTKVLFRGVWMYPCSIRYTEYWDTLKKEAEKNKADIAFFSPKNDATVCLKLMDENELACRYLIHHIDVSVLPRERLWGIKNSR